MLPHSSLVRTYYVHRDIVDGEKGFIEANYCEMGRLPGTVGFPVPKLASPWFFLR